MYQKRTLIVKSCLTICLQKSALPYEVARRYRNNKRLPQYRPPTTVAIMSCKGLGAARRRMLPQAVGKMPTVHAKRSGIAIRINGGRLHMFMSLAVASPCTLLAARSPTPRNMSGIPAASNASEITKRVTPMPGWRRFPAKTIPGSAMR